MTNDLQAIFEHCRRFAYAIAPELRKFPLYFLTTDDLPRQPPECLAYTGGCNQQDPLIRDVLIARGDWVGPGRTIVYRMDQFADYSDLRRAMVDVLIHELAHNLRWNPRVVDIEPTTTERVSIAATHERELVMLNNATPQVLALGDHGRDFTRAACHLWHRAMWQGHHAEPYHLCAGDRYKMSHPLDYIEALSDEPVRLRMNSIQTIMTITPPHRFTELWEKDLENIL